MYIIILVVYQPAFDSMHPEVGYAHCLFKGIGHIVVDSTPNGILHYRLVIHLSGNNYILEGDIAELTEVDFKGVLRGAGAVVDWAEHLGYPEVDHEFPCAYIGGLVVADLAFNVEKYVLYRNTGAVESALINFVS